MLFKPVEKLSKRTFAAFKWLLTAVSGVVTTGFILILES
jgi:hypothetical protein